MFSSGLSRGCVTSSQYPLSASGHQKIPHQAIELIFARRASPIEKGRRCLGFVFEFVEDRVEGREFAGQLLKLAGSAFAGSMYGPG
jgi:hypothetical protein